MRFKLAELQKQLGQAINFSKKFVLKDDLLNRCPQILDLSEVNVTGMIFPQETEIILSYQIDYLVTLPSTRSLEPVILSESRTIDEIFMTEEQLAELDEEARLDILLIENEEIDLLASIIDNIILAIPMQVLTKEEQEQNLFPQGTGWTVLSEDDYQALKFEPEEIDPRLAKLKDFYQRD